MHQPQHNSLAPLPPCLPACLSPDPQEAAPSFFHFLCGWTFDEGDISLDEFVLEFFLKRGAPASRMEVRRQTVAGVWGACAVPCPCSFNTDAAGCLLLLRAFPPAAMCRTLA